MLGVPKDCLREARTLRAIDRVKSTRRRHVPSLIEKEVVTSRCMVTKEKNETNDVYTVFPVHDCTQENRSPYFSSIFRQCKWPSLSRSRNFATMITWRHTSPLFWEEPLYWKLCKIQRSVEKRIQRWIL